MNLIDQSLQELYRKANLRLLYPRMISGPEQGQLLSFLTALIKPTRALELGTYAGYSALCIARALPKCACLDTIEIDDELEPFITEALMSSPAGSRVTLHLGDAMKIVPAMYDKGYNWDMVYIDADKRLYPQYLQMMLEILKPGSYIIADNTLWPGAGEIDPLGPPPQSRHALQSYGIARFNHLAATNPRLTSYTFPIRDGLTIIRID